MQALENPDNSYLFLKELILKSCLDKINTSFKKQCVPAVFFDTFGSMLLRHWRQTAKFPIYRQMDGRRIRLLQLPLPVLYQGQGLQPATEGELRKLLPRQIFGSVHKTHHAQAEHHHNPIICIEPKPESQQFIHFSFKQEKKFSLNFLLNSPEKPHVFKSLWLSSTGNKRDTQTWMERT